MTAAARLTVALAQIHCPWADNRRNLERMAGWGEFLGPSFVVDPGGRVVAETHDGTEQLVFATLGEDPWEGGA